MRNAANSRTTAPTIRGVVKAEGRQTSWIVVIAICMLLVLWLIPLLGLVVTSFREEKAIQETAWWTALFNPLSGQGWTIDGYLRAADVFLKPIFTTLAVVIPSVLMPVLFAAYAAYGLSHLEFRGRQLIFAIIVSMLVIPLQAAFIPLLKFWLGLGLKGSWISIWITHSAFGMPLAVSILYGFISRLPKELIEAARSEGASHYQIFWHIVLPLTLPAITAYAVFQFLWTWNDMLVAMIFLNSDKQVVTVALLSLLQRYGTNWQAYSTGAVLTMIIPLIVFFTMQRFVVRGILAGAVKG
jgi:alpha-glucoside transport system permease protein